MPGQLNSTESFNTAGYQGNLFSLIWKLKASGNWFFVVTGSFVWCSNAVYPINDAISRMVPSCGCLSPLCFVFDLLNCKKSSGNKQGKKNKKQTPQLPCCRNLKLVNTQASALQEKWKEAESENTYICIHMNKTWAIVMAIWAPMCLTKGVIPPSNLWVVKFRTQQGWFMITL